MNARTFTSEEFKEHKERCHAAWAKRAPWQTLYDEVYHYIAPYRRPSAGSVGASRVNHLYDSTAVASAMHGAGKLKEDLFAMPLFGLKFGPIGKMYLEKKGIKLREAKRELTKISDIVRSFFQNGNFDNAASEFCIDLFCGTGTLLPLEGDDERPVKFVCVPFDEAALESCPINGIGALFWSTMMSRRAIKAQWPTGQFSTEFKDSLAKTPGGEIVVHQDWVREGNSWEFRVWLEEGKEDNTIVVSYVHKEAPGAVSRYHKIPGEEYGRGPGMMGLPTAKTLNKSIELMLRAGAIQMLGIWGYRPGGSFNPETARFAPGAFWPMNATGGVIGPDVQRLDPASGRMDVAQLVNGELRTQLQAVMNDDRLPDKGATPVSATEVMHRMKRVAQNYVGAYGRLLNETVPPLVKRVIEILHNKKFIETKVDINALLVAIEVQSPMAKAMKAQALGQIFEWLQLVASLKGPEAMELFVKLDDLLMEAGELMGVSEEFLLTETEREALEKKLKDALASMAAAQVKQQQADAGPQAQTVAA